MLRDYNVFEPDDLDLAQAILDNVWASMPSHARGGPRGGELRDWLAKQVLTSLKQENAKTEGLKVALLTQTDLAVWS